MFQNVCIVLMSIVLLQCVLLSQDVAGWLNA